MRTWAARAKPPTSSVVFVLSCAAVVAGIAMIYVPAAFILGGAAGASMSWTSRRAQLRRVLP